jgi:hypothetical protein
MTPSGASRAPSLAALPAILLVTVPQQRAARHSTP